MAFTSQGQKNLSSGSQTPVSPPQPTHHYHIPRPHVLGHHPGQRLKEFFTPEGRKVHIAATPEEHEELKKKLPQSEKEGDFDVFIQGSPEHVSFSR